MKEDEVIQERKIDTPDTDKVLTAQVPKVVKPAYQPTASTPTTSESLDDVIASYQAAGNVLAAQTPTTHSQSDIDAERKRYNRERKIAAIGDGLTAMANLFYSTKGAQDMLSGAKSLSDASKARYDELMAQWQDDNAKALDNALKQSTIKSSIYSLLDSKERNALATALKNKELDIKDSTAQSTIYKNTMAGDRDYYKAQYNKAEADHVPTKLKLADDAQRALSAQRRTSSALNTAKINTEGARQAKINGSTEGNYHFSGKDYKSLADRNVAIQQSVLEYNKVHPNNPIKLTTRNAFTGAETPISFDRIAGEYEKRTKADKGPGFDL